MYLIQHYGIKFVSDLRQVGGFLQGLLRSEIFLKVELNTIIQAKPYLYKYTQKLDTVIVFPLVNTQINVLIQIQFW